MFSLSKRINRSTYWLSMVIYLLLLVGYIFLIVHYPYNHMKDGQFEVIPDVPFILILLTLLWYNICLTKQRANDISGEHSLVWFTVSFFAVGIAIGFISSEKITNKYGPQPTGIHL